MKKKIEKNQGKKLKKKRKKRPAYVALKALYGNAEDYYFYPLSPIERLSGGMLGFFLSFFVCMVFFRSFLISIVAGVLFVIPGVRKYRDHLKEKRMRSLLLQFRDMMESLTSSYSAGKNTVEAFQDACADMINIYGERSDIVRELRWIVNGLYNGLNIDALLENFAARSHLDDIESFATIFEVTNRYGGNLRKVVGETRQIISEKIETEMEIQTLLTANKNELNMMILMPVVIMLMLNGMGNMSVVQNTPANVIVKAGAILLFAGAYLWGRKIIDIRI